MNRVSQIAIHAVKARVLLRFRNKRTLAKSLKLISFSQGNFTISLPPGHSARCYRTSLNYKEGNVKGRWWTKFLKQGDKSETNLRQVKPRGTHNLLNGNKKAKRFSVFKTQLDRKNLKYFSSFQTSCLCRIKKLLCSTLLLLQPNKTILIKLFHYRTH